MLHPSLTKNEVAEQDRAGHPESPPFSDAELYSKANRLIARYKLACAYLLLACFFLLILCLFNLVPFLHFASPSLVQEPQERLRNLDAILLVGDAVHAVLISAVGDDTAVLAHLEDLSHHVLCELGVALHRYHPARDIHGLVGTDLCVRQLYYARWEREHGIAVHLMN